MKILAIAFFVLLGTSIYAQDLYIDFEGDITTSDFTDFDGGTATVLPNPQSNGINTSSTVAQIVRDGGADYAGSKIILSNNLDFSTMNAISMKVFTTAPVGTQIKFKLEGNGAAERDMFTTVSGEWETLTWDFTGTPANFNEVVFMFDFGNIGNGSANSTFLFDDVQQLFAGFQIDLPVDFESETVNYTLTDFEGNESFLTEDPTDASNTVAQVMKTSDASPSGGTTIGTPAGFATNIPLSLTDSKMNVRVWSPKAGIPIRLKVEDSKDPTRTCETEENTTVAGDWETIEFDFLNHAPGTELLSVGLSMGWTYNMASIFFNFGADGASDNGQIYYFDDVKFGEVLSSTKDLSNQVIKVFPNPSSGQWNILSEIQNIEKVEVYTLRGVLIKTINTPQKSFTINGVELPKGIYLARIKSELGTSSIRLLKE